MPTTPNGRWSPDGTDGIDDLVADLAMMQTTNESADAVTRALITAPSAASATARDLLYPAPVQGNRVARTDLGWEEMYYGTYNASTNPGGATPSGWYPIAGVMPKYAIWRNISSSFGAGAWTNWQWLSSTVIENRGGFSVGAGQPTQILVPYRGWYDVVFKMDWAQPVTAADRYVRVDTDGTAPFNSYQQIGREAQGIAPSTKIITVQVLANTYITAGGYNGDSGGLMGINPQINIVFRQPAI